MINQPITTEALSDHVLSVVPGRMLDNSNAHEMVDALSKAQHDGYTHILIEMTDLQFLSSAGVGSILGTVEAFRDAGGDIVLCNPSESIRHILQVLDLAEYLTIATDRSEAGRLCGLKR